MSRPIKASKNIEKTIRKEYKDFLDEMNKEFESSLKNLKLADGKFSFTKSFTKQFSCNKEKARIIFTPLAYLKMRLLLETFDKEVAWHGVAHKREDVDEGFEDVYLESKKNDYIISDIIVYPQKVSGCYVDMDPTEYAKWIVESYDDPRRKNMRMQAHSHVNMETTPSSVDLESQKKLLEQVKDDEFYIFMIWNKKYESNIRIYDLRKNILFENEDIEIEIADKDVSLTNFLKSADSLVKNLTTKSIWGDSKYDKSSSNSNKDDNNKRNSKKPIKRIESYYEDFDEDYYSYENSWWGSYCE